MGKPVGLRHIALKVDNIEQTLDEITLLAIPINSNWLGKCYCYIEDPDGLKVGLKTSNDL